MKKILVPCDFSQPSREAFKVAHDIAQRSHGEIVLFYAIPNPALYDPGMMGEGLVYIEQMIADMEALAISNFERMKAEMGRNAVPISMVLKTGGIFTSLFDEIKSARVDLVVMGTSGTSGLEEIFIGSNTERVIRFSPVPVLAVHSAFRVAAIKHIVVPSTLALDQPEFMDRVKALQDFFKATLHILHINTPIHFRAGSEGRKAYNEFVSRYNLENCQFHFLTHYKEEEGILEFMESERLDLLVMGTHSRKGLSHLLNGSMTENVVNHTTFPVWTCTLKIQQ